MCIFKVEKKIIEKPNQPKNGQGRERLLFSQPLNTNPGYPLKGPTWLLIYYPPPQLISNWGMCPSVSCTHLGGVEAGMTAHWRWEQLAARPLSSCPGVGWMSERQVLL